MIKIYENLDLQDLKNEIWKDIKNYEGLYQISNLGRVKSFIKWKGTNCRILKQIKNGAGYFAVVLYKNKKYKNKQVHNLVFETFKEKLEKDYDIHHINKDEKYNYIDNLESKSHSKHVGDHNKGENNPAHKLTEEDVIQIKLLLKEGKLTQKEIAEKFKVSKIIISLIKYGKIWSHVHK